MTSTRKSLKGWLHNEADPSNERGNAGVQAAMIFPVILAVIFTIIQGALVYHAGNIADASAGAACNEARLYESTNADGYAAGYETAHQSGSSLHNTQISITRTGDDVTATVTGNAPSLIPGLPLHVSRTVTGPIEEWTT